jgi:hypothetical protein
METQATRRPEAIDAPENIIRNRSSTFWVRVRLALHLILFTFLSIFVKLCIKGLYIIHILLGLASSLAIRLICLQLIMDVLNSLIGWRINGGVDGAPRYLDHFIFGLTIHQVLSTLYLDIKERILEKQKLNLDSQLAMKKVDVAMKKDDLDSQLAMKKVDLDSQLAKKKIDLDSQLAMKKIDLEMYKLGLDNQLAVEKVDIEVPLAMKEARQ